VRSVTQSVVCALTGVALRDGVLPGTAAPIARDLASSDTLDSADSAVTVRHLLTMTSGYAWDETTGSDYNSWIVADNHVQYLLDRPHTAPPAATFTYNPAAVHALGVVLEDAAATPLPRYATDHLFGALGVDTVAWEPLDRGTVNGGSGIALRARDLLKFGQLFLQRGWSGNASVVPESWLDSVTRPQLAWRTAVGPLNGSPTACSGGCPTEVPLRSSPGGTAASSCLSCRAPISSWRPLPIRCSSPTSRPRSSQPKCSA
jgi:CubicO group peptidase (beta-lactamase class C family)